MKENTEDKDEKTASESDDKKISASQISVLAKDVFDIRCLIKKVINNRALISQRLNLISLIFGIVYTFIYIAYVIYSVFVNKLSMGLWVAAAAFVAAYAVIAVTIIIFITRYNAKNTKEMKRYGKMLKVFRLIAKFLSIVIAIYALVVSVIKGGGSAVSVAVNTIMIIFSIIVIVFQLLLLFGGGVVGICRWLLSPVKRKVRFSVVAVDWYNLVTSGDKSSKNTGRVSKKYVDEVGASLEKYIMPALGEKYIGQITSDDLIKLLTTVADEDLYVVSGEIKNLFRYAMECGYISENPCKGLTLEGDINDKEKKTLSQKFSGVMKKVNMVKDVGKTISGFFSSDDD